MIFDKNREPLGYRFLRKSDYHLKDESTVPSFTAAAEYAL
jgi:hypothetical protein